MAMFESLSNRLETVFDKLRGKTRLSAVDVEEAMREVRKALLEADVNYKVVKDFVSKVQEKALGSVGEQVLDTLHPVQQLMGIVNDELIEILGGQQSELIMATAPPTIIMLVGLQGSGKTTTIAKLGNYLRSQGQRPLMVAADVYRPAAITQLQTLGRQLDIPVYAEEGQRSSPPEICVNAMKEARAKNNTIVLLDTAGRIVIDEEMMTEVATIRQRLAPQDVLLVADAMTGQDAVRVAEEFHARVGLTGLILTKMDGDARGGAALSIRAVTGVPIKFIGMGEKTDALEPFFPERLASRILGMGDIASLIEKAQAHVDEKEAERMENKLRTATFDLEDFLNQMNQLKKMGPLTQLLELIPGMNKLTTMPEFKEALDGDHMKKIEAIILSMTPQERQEPDLVSGNSSRRKRIARGSGTTVADLNNLLHSFSQMRQMMKQMGKGKNTFGGLGDMFGGGGNPFGGMDPFGGGLSGGANPFGNLGGGANPFGGRGALPQPSYTRGSSPSKKHNNKKKAKHKKSGRR